MDNNIAIFIVIIFTSIFATLIYFNWDFLSQTITRTVARPTVLTTTQAPVFMDSKGNILINGESVSCNDPDNFAGNGAVYRFDGTEKLRHYPSGTIANSWDPTWATRKGLDCSKYKLGSKMELKISDKDTLKDGQSVSCSGPEDPFKQFGAVYRFDKINNTVRHYPNESIANSWDNFWRNIKGLDCSKITVGDDMELKISDKDTLNMGQAVSCSGIDKLKGHGAVYRFDGTDKLRHYPNPPIADSWDSNWRNIKGLDCSKFTLGVDMELNAPTSTLSTSITPAESTLPVSTPPVSTTPVSTTPVSTNVIENFITLFK